mgnify:CR=1 FL=1
MQIEHRLEYAKWVLERNLHWIGAAEVKIGVVVAIDTAMLAGLAAVFSLTGFAAHSWEANAFSALAAVALIAAFICTAATILPKTDGPKTSFVFFGKIINVSRAEYAAGFKQAEESEFLADLLDQIHRNAEIAMDKFWWVRNAMTWSFVALPLWIAAIVFLLKGR